MYRATGNAFAKGDGPAENNGYALPVTIANDRVYPQAFQGHTASGVPFIYSLDPDTLTQIVIIPNATLAPNPELAKRLDLPKDTLFPPQNRAGDWISIDDPRVKDEVAALMQMTNSLNSGGLLNKLAGQGPVQNGIAKSIDQFADAVTKAYEGNFPEGAAMRDVQRRGGSFFEQLKVGGTTMAVGIIGNRLFEYLGSGITKFFSNSLKAAYNAWFKSEGGAVMKEVEQIIARGEKGEITAAEKKLLEAAKNLKEAFENGDKTAINRLEKEAEDAYKELQASRKSPDTHHLMTDKNRVSPASGGPYTQKFEALAEKRGITLKDAMNKLPLPGHGGPHPKYNRAVYDRLLEATNGLKGEEYNIAFDKELERIRAETFKVGTLLNRLATRQ